jgi:iron complex transport system substrate-binding protein
MRTRLVAAVAAVALAAAACGGSTADTTTTTAESPTTTTTTAAVTTTTAATLAYTGADDVTSIITDTSRIVSLSGDFTEIIFALGLGADVVGIDVTTTYPDEAKNLDSVGFAQELSAEAVLGLEPSLVLANTLTAPSEAIDQIRAAGVPVVVLDSGTSLDAVAPKIEAIGQILGVSDAAATLAQQVQGQIDAARALAAQADQIPKVAYLYTRGPQVLLIFGLGTATNAMITAAGATDAGADSGIMGAAPLTAEALVAAAPDVIVLPRSGVDGLGGLDAVAALPGVASTPAGESGSYLVYDEAYFFNLGPRAGQALMQFVTDLHPELAGG